VAPNIYYLGVSGVVNFRGITIAGLSGIYKRYHYNQGHHERLPFTEDTKRSIYHIREYDVHKLSLLSSPTIFMSHDWPTGIHRYGDHKALLRKKPHFIEDIEKGELGSQPAEMLLKKLRPKYWFSAHLHVKFAAFVEHDAEQTDDEGEIVLDDSLDEEKREKSPGKRTVSPSTMDSESKRRRQDTSTSTENSTTRFLALDKCLPHRDFLQILDIEEDSLSSDTSLSYDPQWLAIVKTFHTYLSTTMKLIALPSDDDLQTYFLIVLT
jgi:lariat debranching enzyme